MRGRRNNEEPTATGRKIVLDVMPGDVLEITCGGMRPWETSVSLATLRIVIERYHTYARNRSMRLKKMAEKGTTK